MADVIKKNVVLFLAMILMIIFALSKSNLNPFSRTGSSLDSRLEAVLPQPGSDFDFTQTLLRISALFDGNPDVTAAEDAINKMAIELKSKIGDKGDPQDRIEAMNSYFFDELGFIFNEKAQNFVATGDTSGLTGQDVINFNSVNYALTNRQGICISISLIYLMLADKLKLPIYGVIVPSHFYCRYKEQGKGAINIETTAEGMEYYEYESMPGGNIELIGEGTAYNKPLTKAEVIGAYMSNAGLVYLALGKKKDAEVFLRNAVKYAGNLPEAYNNLGYVLLQLGKDKEGEEMLLKASRIYPGYWMPYASLGSLYLSEKRYLKAEENLDKASRLKPGDPQIQEMLEEAKAGGR